MEKSFLIRLNDGTTKIIRESEAIENALKQEAEGIDDRRPREGVAASGPRVVYRRSDDKMIVATGFQGDFCYI